MVSAVFAMSQDLTYLAVPVRLNCSEQSAGVAMTVTGARSVVSSLGREAVWVYMK